MRIDRAKYILPLLADFGHGLASASLVGMAYGTDFSLALLVWSLGFAFLLDLDNVGELLRGHFSAHKDHPVDHRDGWHYPLPWLAVFALVFFGFGANVWTVTAVLGIGLHFINDLFGTGWGIKLAWPFSHTRYKFFTKKDASKLLTVWPVVVRYGTEEMPHIIRTQGDPYWVDTVYLRITALTMLEYSIFLLGCGAVSYWVLVY